MDFLRQFALFDTQLVLGAAFGFMALVLVGGVVKEQAGALGSLIRVVGNVGLAGAFGLTMLQLLHLTTVPPAQAADDDGTAQVSGQETRVMMGADGHFWVKARINGRPQRFLIDTGATLTTLSQAVADAADVPDDKSARAIVLHTANGAVAAHLGRIARLQVGNVTAKDTRTVIAPDLGGTNVLGMNFLSRLAGWRVEGQTLILTPKPGQRAG